MATQPGAPQCLCDGPVPGGGLAHQTDSSETSENFMLTVLEASSLEQRKL